MGLEQSLVARCEFDDAPRTTTTRKCTGRVRPCRPTKGLVPSASRPCSRPEHHRGRGSARRRRVLGSRRCRRLPSSQTQSRPILLRGRLTLSSSLHGHDKHRGATQARPTHPRPRSDEYKSCRGTSLLIVTEEERHQLCEAARVGGRCRGEDRRGGDCPRRAAARCSLPR